MKDSELWKQFLETGDVLSYLRYRAEAVRTEQGAEREKQPTPRETPPRDAGAAW